MSNEFSPMIGIPPPLKEEQGPTAPYEIEKELVTIAAHCTAIADEPLTMMQVELLNCIRWGLADIRKALTAISTAIRDAAIEEHLREHRLLAADTADARVKQIRDAALEEAASNLETEHGSFRAASAIRKLKSAPPPPKQEGV